MPCAGPVPSNRAFCLIVQRPGCWRTRYFCPAARLSNVLLPVCASRVENRLWKLARPRYYGRATGSSGRLADGPAARSQFVARQIAIRPGADQWTLVGARHPPPADSSRFRHQATGTGVPPSRLASLARFAGYRQGHRYRPLAIRAAVGYFGRLHPLPGGDRT